MELRYDSLDEYNDSVILKISMSQDYKRACDRIRKYLKKKGLDHSYSIFMNVITFQVSAGDSQMAYIDDERGEIRCLELQEVIKGLSKYMKKKNMLIPTFRLHMETSYNQKINVDFGN